MNQSNNKNNDYMFFGYDVLHGRIGLGVSFKDLTPEDDERAIKELIEIYKNQYKYKDVMIKKDPNDPTMVMIYVKSDKPYFSNII